MNRRPDGFWTLETSAGTVYIFLILCTVSSLMFYKFGWVSADLDPIQGILMFLTIGLLPGMKWPRPDLVVRGRSEAARRK